MNGVLIIQDVRPWGTSANEQVLSANGLVYDLIGSALLTSTNLSTYKMVLIPGDQPTSYYGTVAGRAAQLAAYVAAGGVLEFHAAGWGFAGGDASVVTLPGGMHINQFYSSTNRVLSPGHPLMAGVPDPFIGNSASHSYFSSIPAGAVAIANDGTGRTNLVQYRFGLGTVIAGGQTFEYGYTFGQHAGIILRNMIPYAHSLAPRWLSVDPPSGVVPAGSSMDVVVTFDGTNLVGGDYDADLVVSSNDPDEPEALVPVLLHVTGAPDIVVPTMALDFSSLFVGARRTLNLTIENAGTDSLVVSAVSSDSSAFNVDPDSFTLAVGGTIELHVTFMPPSAGPFDGTLTIRSNDPDEPASPVALHGEGLIPPDIDVTPQSFDENLLSGQTVPRPLRLRPHSCRSDMTRTWRRMTAHPRTSGPAAQRIRSRRTTTAEPICTSGSRTMGRSSRSSTHSATSTWPWAACIQVTPWPTARPGRITFAGPPTRPAPASCRCRTRCGPTRPSWWMWR